MELWREVLVHIERVVVDVQFMAASNIRMQVSKDGHQGIKEGGTRKETGRTFR